MTIIKRMQKIGEIGMAMSLLLSQLSRASVPPDERDRTGARELIRHWDEAWGENWTVDGEMNGDSDNPRDT